MPIKVNYVDDHRPYCWKDENGKVHGTFRKAIEIAASFLNLTLVIKETMPENRNIWSKRYMI